MQQTRTRLQLVVNCTPNHPHYSRSSSLAAGAWYAKSPTGAADLALSMRAAIEQRGWLATLGLLHRRTEIRRTVVMGRRCANC